MPTVQIFKATTCDIHKIGLGSWNFEGITIRNVVIYTMTFNGFNMVSIKVCTFNFEILRKTTFQRTINLFKFLYFFSNSEKYILNEIQMS